VSDASEDAIKKQVDDAVDAGLWHATMKLGKRG
jgi:hypothetical protein